MKISKSFLVHLNYTDFEIIFDKNQISSKIIRRNSFENVDKN